MLSNQDIVVFSDDWHGLPTAAIHVFKQLAARNRIFWFNTMGRLPRLSASDAGKVGGKVAAWFRGQDTFDSKVPTRRLGDVQLFDPIMVPWFRRGLRRFNQQLFLRKFRRATKLHNIQRPIVVTTLPCAYDFVRMVNAAKVLYYCLDDYENYPGLNHRDWTKLETRLLRHIDGLVVSSQELAGKCRNGCPVLYLPHGVDIRHFRRQADAVPSIDPRIKPPVVGFFGLIENWVDLDLILSLSREFQHVTFVLIGKANINVDVLRQRKNVCYLGYRPYAELPAVASCFDIGLIPFKFTPLTRAVNPLKLLEYFSLGLPVLASSLPELERAKGPIWLARTHADFARQLASILRSDLTTLRSEARTVALRHTWEQRADVLGQFVQNVGTCSRN
jgi:glycosyltransferase involved in cell wall biosynthesis